MRVNKSEEKYNLCYESQKRETHQKSKREAHQNVENIKNVGPAALFAQ